jgi:hypothetical protein
MTAVSLERRARIKNTETTPRRTILGLQKRKHPRVSKEKKARRSSGAAEAQ